MPSGRRRLAPAVLWAAGGLVAGTLTLVACGPDAAGPVEEVRAGDALGVTASDSLSSVSLPPGQEVVELDAGLINDSDEPLEITKLRPVETKGVPDAAQIVRVALVDGSSIDGAGGLFVTFPPVARRDGACVRSKVFPARGATLQPDQAPLILVWLRTVAEGRVSVPAFTATYEQGGELFQQTVRIDGGYVFNVRNDAEALKPSRDERACASHVQLLPGAVHI